MCYGLKEIQSTWAKNEKNVWRVYDRWEAKADFKTYDMSFQLLPAGGEKDTVEKKWMTQASQAHKYMVLWQD